jgi:hypothetical protein
MVHHQTGRKNPHCLHWPAPGMESTPSTDAAIFRESGRICIGKIANCIVSYYIYDGS